MKWSDLIQQLSTQDELYEQPGRGGHKPIALSIHANGLEQMFPFS
jgi:hypothetical protein